MLISCISLLLCLAAPAQNAPGAQQELLLYIQPGPETEILVGEPVMMSFWLKNQSDHDITIPRHAASDHIRISHISPIKGLAGPYADTPLGEDMGLTLRPGDRFCVCRDFHMYARVQPSGAYEYSAAYGCPGSFLQRNRGTGELQRISCWKGRIEAETVKFIVREPVSPEDKEALDILKARMRLDYDYSAMYRSDSSKQTLEEVIARYPNSTYAKYCAYYLGRSQAGVILRSSGTGPYWLGKALDQLGKVVDDYATFSFTDDALFWSAYCMLWGGKRNEALAMLGRIRREFPDSDILHSAEYYHLMDDMAEFEKLRVEREAKGGQ